MKNSVRVVTLFFLALNCMAQTLPRPTGLYFEPLLEGQSGMLQDDSDKIIPQIANHGTPPRRWILHDLPSHQRLSGHCDVPSGILRQQRGSHEHAAGDKFR